MSMSGCSHGWGGEWSVVLAGGGGEEEERLGGVREERVVTV